MTKDTNPEALMIELKKKGPVSQPAGIFNFIEIHPHKVEMATSNTSMVGSVTGLLSEGCSLIRIQGTSQNQRKDGNQDEDPEGL